MAKIRFGDLYKEPSRNGLTKPKKVRGQGTKFINMGEMFAYDRLLNAPADRAPLNDKETGFSLLEPKDLLFARQSLVLSGAGKCSIFPIDTVFYVELKGSTPLYWVFLRLSLMDIQKLGTDSAVPGVNRNAIHAQKCGENLGLNDDEIAFYDALEVNDSAVQLLGDDTLKLIAQEFGELGQT